VKGRKEKIDLLKSFYKSISFFFAEDSKDKDLHMLNFKEDSKLINSQTIIGSFFAFDLFINFPLGKGLSSRVLRSERTFVTIPISKSSKSREAAGESSILNLSMLRLSLL